MDTPDLTRAQWHTSTYSGGNGSCIEVAATCPALPPSATAKIARARSWSSSASSGTASSAHQSRAAQQRLKHSAPDHGLPGSTRLAGPAHPLVRDRSRKR